MVAYDEQHKLLFSADAFGTFGALAGNIFDDEINFDSAWMNDARRYYPTSSASMAHRCRRC